MPGTETSGKSQTASRYESVATSRNPSSSEVNSTPVRIGRDSSLLAARSTWPTACRNIEAGRVTAASAGWPRRGKSSIENGRTVNEERSPVISTVSPPASTTTAPGASVRTASAVSRPGTTQEPSRSPLTSMVRWIVSSRSVPLISRREPSRINRTPARTGCEPARPCAARAAVARASPSTSRSQRNFTVAPLPSVHVPRLARSSSSRCSLNLVVVIGPGDCVVRGIRRVQAAVHSSPGGASRPQRQPSRRCGQWMTVHRSPARTPVVPNPVPSVAPTPRSSAG